MRIGIDGAALSRPGTGLAVYTESLAFALARLRPEDEFFVLSTADMSFEDRRVPRNLDVRVMPSRLGASAGAMTGPASWAKALSLDLYHAVDLLRAPLSTPCARVVTAHDLSPIRTPGAHASTERWLSLFWAPIAAGTAQAVIVPSRSSRIDVRREYGVPSERIAVIPYGLSAAFARRWDAPALNEVRNRLHLPHPFILSAASWGPRSNQAGLLRAYGLALSDRRLPHSLVFAGAAAPSRLDLPAGLRGRVVHIGRVSQQDLPAVYRMADFAAFPTLGEGFGLPALEAMASGAPVLVSLEPAVEELTAGAAYSVDATDPETLADGLVRLATDTALKDELRKRGLARAAEFTWDAAARATWSVYEDALKRSDSPALEAA